VDGSAPASHTPSTLWGEALCFELQLTDLGPCCWPHPSAGGLGQVARRGEGSHPALWGEDILPLGRLAANWEKIVTVPKIVTNATASRKLKTMPSCSVI
jgi:hypothetical protein